MPNTTLKVTRAPRGGVDEAASERGKPLFRGTGDTDYLCGNCGSVIAANMGPNQRVIVDSAICSACGAENEFPPNLRAWTRASMRPARWRSSGIEMPKTHPHAEATYRVITFDNGSFGVEVSIPDSQPTTVSMFKAAADAEAWIAEHRRRIESQTQSGRWFRSANSRGR